jgi:multiple sugar transport system permease protein
MAVQTAARVALREQRGRSEVIRRIVLYFILAALSVIFLAPLFWMLSTSLKSDQQLGLWPPIWVPVPAIWQNYALAWTSAPFALYTRNTLIITVGAVAGHVLCSCAVAYGFARLRFPGRDALFLIVLATMMLPGVVTLIPSFILFQKLGWLDTFLPLVVPAWFGAAGGAFFIFLLRQFFRAIPMELSEAARIDGASNLRILLQLVLPLSRPAIATVLIFSFTGNWNDFLGPLIYLNTNDHYTLTIGMQVFMQQHGTQYQYLMAISFLMSLPIILVFFFAQQHFIRGIAMSGIKG